MVLEQSCPECQRKSGRAVHAWQHRQSVYLWSKSSQYLKGRKATMGNKVGLRTRFVFHKLMLLALAGIRLPVTRLDPWVIPIPVPGTGLEGPTARRILLSITYRASGEARVGNQPGYAFLEHGGTKTRRGNGALRARPKSIGESLRSLPGIISHQDSPAVVA